MTMTIYVQQIKYAHLIPRYQAGHFKFGQNKDWENRYNSQNDKDNMHKLYQSTKVEHDKPVEGTVIGDIPSWVSGSLYRNGPGLYEFGEDKYNHMFDPLAMFQRFQICDKKVTYQSRYLQSDVLKKNMAAQRIVVSGFGTVKTPDPCHNIFKRFLSYFEPEDKSDNSIVSFYPLKDDLYAASETNLIHRVDPETLLPIEKVDLSDFVAVNSATAHPHWDPDGTVHNIGHSYKGKPKICIIKIPPKKAQTDNFPSGEVMSALESEYKMSINYFHSFGMTENYYVYVEQPMYINILKILTKKLTGSAVDTAIDFYDNINARFRIIDKRDGSVVNPEFRYEAKPFVIFHHINAYEENGHIILDVCCFNTKAPLDYVYLKDLTSEQCEANWKKIEEPEPRRYVLPLNVNANTPKDENLVSLKYSTATAKRQSDDVIFCTKESLAETGFEFPQTNYSRFNGKKYRFTYGIGWHNSGPHFHTLCKIDLDTKTHTEWAEDKCYPSEPVFVANPDGTDEDDGVLLSAVNSSDFDAGKNAFLLVLDAKSMKEIARAEFSIQRFPKDFHGLFRPNM